MAQSSPNNFGGQDRADAASQMIVLAVQQGISSLPPTAGQSFVYEFDPTLNTFVRSDRLGPISFRTPLTIGEGRMSFRFAASYFDASEKFGPMQYSVVDLRTGSQVGFTQFGLAAEARAGIFNFGFNYGLTDRIELTVNVPVSVVDASAEQSFPTFFSDQDLPPGAAPVGLQHTIGDLNALLDDGIFVTRQESFTVEGKEFNDGTSVGMGRADIGAKLGILTEGAMLLAFSTEFFFPSPSQDEFAGSDSPAILPRLIAQYDVDQALHLHLDAGYDYDFDVAQLRRFVWNVGASIARPRYTIDLGVGGSKFDAPIRWTPASAMGDPTADFPDGTELTALGDSSLGTNYVDVLAGFKLRLSEDSVLGGSVSVPVTSDGFRPDAFGTLAFEVYF